MPYIVMLTYAFIWHILTSLSIDEILLPRYVNMCTIFRGLPLKVKMAPYCLKLSFICVPVDTYVSCCLLQTILLGFCLSRYTCKKR